MKHWPIKLTASHWSLDVHAHDGSHLGLNRVRKPIRHGGVLPEEPSCAMLAMLAPDAIVNTSSRANVPVDIIVLADRELG